MKATWGQELEADIPIAKFKLRHQPPEGDIAVGSASFETRDTMGGILMVDHPFFRNRLPT